MLKFFKYSLMNAIRQFLIRISRQIKCNAWIQLQFFTLPLFHGLHKAPEGYKLCPPSINCFLSQ